MRNQNKSNRIAYIISILFVVILVGLYVGLRDFKGLSLMEKYRMLCDAFTIPGVLLILVGALVWASDLGGFYGIGFVFNYAKKSLTHFFVPGSLGNTESYYDYIERKKSEGHLTGYGFLFIVGGITMAIALVFLFLFYQYY